MTDIMTLEQLLPLGIVATLALLVLLLWLWMRARLSALKRSIDSQAQQHQQWQAAHSELEDAVAELRTGSIGLGKRLVAVEAKLKQTEAKTEALAEMDPDQRVYNKAAQLVAQGYGVKDIMDSCGLSRAEAELVVNLHKPA